MTVRSQPGRGTRVSASFRLSHIDRKPLGSMALTIVTLVAGWPDVDLRYRHDRDGRSVCFRSADVRVRLGDVPLNTPDVLNFIARYLAQEEESLSHSG